jgi:formate dehydrogenase major subunit
VTDNGALEENKTASRPSPAKPDRARVGTSGYARGRGETGSLGSGATGFEVRTGRRRVDIRDLIPAWSVVRQARGKDPLALGKAAQSARQANLKPRTAEADEVVRSICPYCAVGCGQRIFVKNGEVTQIEGDPDSPISRGRLCPKGAASRSYVQSSLREYKVKYRRPYSTEWEELELEAALDMIADRLIKTREETWEDEDENEVKLHRTLGIAHLGGATLDNEENYLMKKFYTAMGAIQVENQARI